jgi:chemotaxis protein CheX
MQTTEMIRATHGAVGEVFSTMLGLEVEPCEAHSDSGNASTNDGVMAFVGITGPWVGNGIISCSADCARRLCEAFLMTEAPAVTEEVLDAVGELANMVVGNFKTAAEAQVGQLGLTVPTVIYGRNFTSRNIGNNEWFVMPFKCGDDVLEVRIWFAPAAESNAARHAGNFVHMI